MDALEREAILDPAKPNWLPERKVSLLFRRRTEEKAFSCFRVTSHARSVNATFALQFHCGCHDRHSPNYDSEEHEEPGADPDTTIAFNATLAEMIHSYGLEVWLWYPF